MTGVDDLDLTLDPVELAFVNHTQNAQMVGLVSDDEYLVVVSSVL